MRPTRATEVRRSRSASNPRLGASFRQERALAVKRQSTDVRSRRSGMIQADVSRQKTSVAHVRRLPLNIQPSVFAVACRRQVPRSVHCCLALRTHSHRLLAPIFRSHCIVRRLHLASHRELAEPCSWMVRWRFVSKTFYT
jgi:hypothetical protein